MDRGGSATFEEWYSQEHRRVLGSMVALAGDRHLAAEVTDEAFVRALARWSRVQRMASPTGWTYRVALNCLRRAQRRSGTERRAIDRTVAGAATSDGVLDSETHPEVWAAVRALPPKQRVTIVLRYVADLPEAVIAETMGVSRGTVSSNLADARRSLAALLTEDPPVEATAAEDRPARGIEDPARRPAPAVATARPNPHRLDLPATPAVDHPSSTELLP